MQGLWWLSIKRFSIMRSYAVSTLPEWMKPTFFCLGIQQVAVQHCCHDTCQLLEPLEYVWVNTLRPRQNGRHFADDTFKHIFLKENFRISIKISLKFVPKSPIDNILALFQIMAWRRPGDKPLSEAMMVSLLTHIWVARPQWVKDLMIRCLSAW